MKGDPAQRGHVAGSHHPSTREPAPEEAWKSEELFRATFEQVAVGMAHVGLNGRWLRVNEKLCDIVGYTRDELTGLTFQHITYPDDLDADLTHMHSLLAGTINTYAMEKRYVRKDHSLAYTNLTVSLVRDAAGSPAYFIAVIEDIAARVQAIARTARLQAIAAALSSALTMAQVADVIVDEGLAALGADAGIVAVLSDDGSAFNALRIVGYPAEAAEAWRSWPADAPVAIGEAVREGAPIILETRTERQSRYPHLAGSPTFTREGAAVALPLLVGGQPIGGIGLSFLDARHFDAEDRTLMRALADLCAQALDRTRLYDAERRSREEAERATRRLQTLQLVTDTALIHVRFDELVRQLLARITEALRVDNTAILLLDGEGQDLVVYLAHGPEEAVAGQMRVPVGAGVAGHIAARRQPLIVDDMRLVEPVNPLLREQMASLMGVPLLIEDRLVGVMHVDSTTPRRFCADELHLLQLVADRVALALDNARLYALEQDARTQAEAATRLRDDILGLATHDLRSPLTSVLGRSQIVQRRLAQGRAVDEEWLGEQMQVVQGSVRRMLTIVDEIADVGRLQMGEALPLQRDDVDICALARLAAEESHLSRDTTVLDMRVPESPVMVHADAARLTRVLHNIVGNALKFSPEGTPVSIAVDVEGSEAVVTVTDRGVGIPADELPHVFTRYFRASTARGIAGTGIGLSGARAIVEQHGGRIDIASVVGQGTTVTVRLPLDAPGGDASDPARV